MKLEVIAQFILCLGVILFLISSILFSTLDINKALHIITGKRIKEEKSNRNRETNNEAASIKIRNEIVVNYPHSNHLIATDTLEEPDNDDTIAFVEENDEEDDEETMLFEQNNESPKQSPRFKIDFEETHLGQ